MKTYLVGVLLAVLLGFGTWLAIATQDQPAGKPPAKSPFDMFFKDSNSSDSR